MCHRSIDADHDVKHRNEGSSIVKVREIKRSDPRDIGQDRSIRRPHFLLETDDLGAAIKQRQQLDNGYRSLPIVGMLRASRPYEPDPGSSAGHKTLSPALHRM